MSADNRICLMETRWGWVAWKGSCSMNYYEPPFDCQDFSNKEAALKWAYDEADKMTILEGGITIVGIEEQMQALREIIDDCQIRINNIEKYGTQFPTNNDLNFR